MVAPGQWPISTSLRMTFVSITRAARAAGGSSSSDRLTRKLGRLSMGLWMPITLNASLSRCETAAPGCNVAPSPLPTARISNVRPSISEAISTFSPCS